MSVLVVVIGIVEAVEIIVQVFDLGSGALFDLLAVDREQAAIISQSVGLAIDLDDSAKYSATTGSTR